MNNKKALKKAMTQPLVMFLLGMAMTLLLLSQITHGVADSNTLKNNEFINNIVELNTNSERSTEIPRQTAEERNRPSPNNFFDETQIRVFNDRVILEADNILWAGFADTKSMLPVINKDSNALQITPKCPEEINIGDIVSYRSNYADGIIIHRVVHVDEDDQGVYFVLKGDNNPSNDPGRIRCNQIDRKVVAIIY